MTDVHQWTMDQCRDWLAEQDGWVKSSTHYDGTPIANMPRGFRWFMHGCIHADSLDDHPHPPTIDGAAAALPRGCTHIRAWRFGGQYEWAAQKYHGINYCWLPATANEALDRYRLAVLVRMAEKESKR